MNIEASISDAELAHIKHIDCGTIARLLVSKGFRKLSGTTLPMLAGFITKEYIPSLSVTKYIQNV